MAILLLRGLMWPARHQLPISALKHFLTAEPEVESLTDMRSGCIMNTEIYTQTFTALPEADGRAGLQLNTVENAWICLVLSDDTHF